MFKDALTPDLETLDPISEQLRSHERQGDYAAAKTLLRNLFRYDAAIVGAGAGHVARWADHPLFWKDLLKQVAEACKRRCDGYALREVEGPVRSVVPVTNTGREGASP